MKVKDLLKDIWRNTVIYSDFLEWDIALEQHPDYKECPNCNKEEDSFELHDYGNKVLFIKSHAGECTGISCQSRRVYALNIHY